MVLNHIRPSLYLPTIMFTWGALTCVMAAVYEYKYLVILRALIGCVEAGFAPGVLLLLSSWYKKDEQAKRFGVYISGRPTSKPLCVIFPNGTLTSPSGRHLRRLRWTHRRRNNPRPWRCSRNRRLEMAFHSRRDSNRRGCHHRTLSTSQFPWQFEYVIGARERGGISQTGRRQRHSHHRR